MILRAAALCCTKGPRDRAIPRAFRFKRSWSLLDLDFCARFFQLLFDRLGFVFAHAFLDGLRRALDERLRFGQTQTGELADRFDDLDLLRTRFGEDHVE